MNLREYLRSEWGKYIRPLVIKKECDFCRSKENLHLHHVDKFYNLLMETLEELQMQELDTDIYSKEELNLISHVMLSKQIRSEYKTLCKDCHFKIHNNEKYKEEYKEYYYNPNGSYIVLNIDELKRLNIDNNIIIRYIYLCCYVNYNNKITIPINKTRHKTVKKEDLFNMLNMSKTEANRTINYLIANDLLHINKDSIIVSNLYCTKGNNNYRNKLKVFINGFIDIYSILEPRKHKILGNIINNSIYDNLVYDHYKLEKYGNITRISQYIKSVNNLGEFKNKKIILNPNIFYCGHLDLSYKKVIEEYNN